MRNEIILNNRSSKEIKGLLIQELPPITKPLIRTTIEEIDGRDGDIITKLGYSAYNKEITIGLYGKFDIDEVISFFDSEGKVIFSNEPDKYYNYQIIDQIDFERLVRYRTAKVTMHCQPFKYAVHEDVRFYNVDGSGSIEIRNNGNIYSRPIITLYGTGIVNLSLNDHQIFVINLGNTSNSITIDTNLLEAYGETPDVLMNRSVDGDYNNFRLRIGTNTISWSGSLTQINIQNYSRWI